jgi:formate hydrogenlyase subunit 4
VNVALPYTTGTFCNEWLISIAMIVLAIASTSSGARFPLIATHRSVRQSQPLSACHLINIAITLSYELVNG